MSISLLIDKIEVEELNLNLKSDSLYHSLFINEGKIPRWENMHIAILGINEYRGQNEDVKTNAANNVRKKLYELKQFKHAIKIVDLGNIKLGENIIDTKERLTELCKMMLEQNVIPLLIGGSHDLDTGQFKSYLNSEEDLNVLSIDSCLDIDEDGEPFETHSREMLLHEPNIIFNYAHIGYQTYLNHPNSTDILEKMNCDHVRLGEIASEIKKIEPQIRFSKMVSFDTSSIKESSFNSNFDPQPFGLTAENACQITWYAGMSNNCNSLGIYGYNPDIDLKLQGAGVIAIMVWYFIDGFYHRQKEDFKSENYRKFTVTAEGEDLIFYKDIRNEMWWTELQLEKHSEIVPCSYDDYLLASTGEIPQYVFDLKMKYL